MKITLDRLLTDGLMLGRCLMALSPRFVDMAMAGDEIGRRARPQSAAGQWYAVHGKESGGFIWAGPTGAGRYQRRPPPDVDPGSLPRIEVKEANRPSLGLLDKFFKLIKGLASGKTMKVRGQEDTTSFSLRPGDAAQLEQLAKMLMLTRTACAEDHDRQTTAKLLGQVRERFFADAQVRSTAAAMVGLVAGVAANVRTMRMANAADAYLASWFTIWEELCQGLEQGLRERRLDEQALAAQMARHVGFAFAGKVCDPGPLTQALAEKMCREGFAAPVERQANLYLKQGEQKIEQALDSKGLDGFGSSLYGACLDLFSARLLFDALQAVPREGLPAEMAQRHVKSADVAEEKCVRAAHALLISVQNRAGVKLDEHRQRVHEARIDGGESAVDDVVFELIELSYYYPRCFAESLRESDTLP